MTGKKKDEATFRKSLSFFVEDPGIFDNHLKLFAKEIILSLTNRLDRPSKTRVGELLGIQRFRLTRILIGLEINEEFDQIVNQKKIEYRRIQKEKKAAKKKEQRAKTAKERGQSKSTLGVTTKKKKAAAKKLTRKRKRQTVDK